jgi:hypothetical protein
VAAKRRMGRSRRMGVIATIVAREPCGAALRASI